uniref:Cell division cycle 20B n=1 Tax=Nothobranchius furzeri TaxID=105023 RepID=A0A8C6P5B8_NOTFU
HLDFVFVFSKATEVTYSRFRRRIIQGGCPGSPAASTPLTARWRCKPVSEFDSVCQRLELESPSKQEDNAGEASPAKSCSQTLLSSNPSQAHTISSRGHSAIEKFYDQRAGWSWRAAGKADEDSQRAGQPLKDSNERNDLRPFSILNDVGESLQGDSVKTYGAPSLLNDYYTDLLDCSSDGVIALALGSAVYIWNSVTNLLVGHLDPGGPRHSALSVSCLCWSRDGRVLCFGNRRGEIKLWDVDHKQNLRHFQSHQSSATAISWSQQLLSSGSALGHVLHLDPRAAAPVVGAARQEEGVCSLQWSPGNEWFASGSTDGHLCIWDGDITGVKRSHQPITTMKQPSAVKALGWCPWQRRVIATGGGWKDGQVRIWDAQSGSGLSSVETHSQICSLRWAEKKRHLITGHGLPYHQISTWSWEFPSLSRIYQLTG